MGSQVFGAGVAEGDSGVLTAAREQQSKWAPNGDASANDAEVSAVREAARLIAEDDRLTPVLIPLGDGLLAAARD